MSLPCLAFSREPCASAPQQPGARAAPGGRGVTRAPPCFASWSGSAAFSSFTSSFTAAWGSLASELIPAGRLGGPERTPETAELPAAALPES